MDLLEEIHPTTTEKDVISQYIIKIRQGEPDPLIGPKEMGELMGFSRPRAYAVLSQLQQKHVVDKIERKGFILTKMGKQLINELIHRTKIMETYFHTEVGLKLTIAEEDAKNSALHVSSTLINRLCELLGQPTFCPHNYQIPHKRDN